MNYTQQNLNEDLQFISSFIAMEKSSLAKSKKFLKSILPSHKFDHLYSSWVGRYDEEKKVGQFGSFYTNIEAKTQALFLMDWGLEIPEYEGYVKELKSSPLSYFTAVPPVLIQRLNFLLVFFLNNGIDSVVNGYSLSDLPKERYGNSHNWGNYVLSLSHIEQYRLLTHLSSYCFEQIKKSENDRGMFKNAKLIPTH